MMTSGFARLARKVGVAICLLVVGGCGLTDQENMWICSKLPDLNPSEVFKLNPRERLNRCIVKWGYRLSRAPDPARTVADATFANCSGLLLEAQEFRIAEWNGNAASINRDALKGKKPGDVGAPHMPMANELEQERYLEKEVLEEAKGLSLFSVVQARAGNCKIPEVV